MKKTVKIISIVCMIAMLMGMLPIMNVSAADEATLVVTAPETVSQGRTFNVTVSIANNPGIWSIKFNMPIDTNAFEFITDGGDAEVPYEGTILASGDGMSGYSEANGYTFNRTYTDKFNNTTANGALVVLTLRAKTDAVLGDYTFAATVDEANTINVSTSRVAVENGTTNVEVVPYVAATIDSADVMLGTDISVEYYATIDSAYAGAEMVFTMNGVETVVAGEATGNADEYVFVFNGVAPQCMGDNIKAELVFEEEVIAVKDDYSVLTYCNNILANTAGDLGLEESQYAALETLIADLLVYGAKAQLYRDYKTTALVDADVTNATEFVVPESAKYVEETSDETMYMTALGVFFDYTNSLYVKFSAADITEDGFRVVLESDVTGDEFIYTLADFELIDEATSTYLLKMADIPVTAYSDLYIITLQTPRSATRWNDIQIAEYSIDSYVCSMLESDNAEMVELAKALYNYGVSATAYNNALNG